MNEKQKATYCYNRGFKFDYKKGWHIVVSWQAKSALKEKEYVGFMKDLGWENNINGMLRLKKK